MWKEMAFKAKIWEWCDSKGTKRPRPQLKSLMTIFFIDDIPPLLLHLLNSAHFLTSGKSLSSTYQKLQLILTTWCYKPRFRVQLNCQGSVWLWFKRDSNSGFRQSHMPQALWCYIPVTPSTRLYLRQLRQPLPHWHWFIEQKNESKISKQCLNQGSDTATCLRLSDVISLSQPPCDCIWDCHCHTDTYSWSRRTRVKITKQWLNQGSDTATC